MRQKKRGERRVKRSIDETQTMEITLEKRIPTTRYRPDHQTGLTAQQVQEHRMHGWTNQPVDPPSKTTKEIIQENVFTYFNLIFLVLAVLLCLGRFLSRSDLFTCNCIEYSDTGSFRRPGRKKYWII